LSLTLRDAQYLSWKTFRKIEIKNQTVSDTAEKISELTEKAVELVKNMEKSGGSIADKEELGNLFSRIIFFVFVLGEREGISLEDSFLQAMDNYILDLVK
jgi:NTP pyrophosphatase (non-canonical NTP hydrolase)